MIRENATREEAPAKINLALHVRRRRADGYHELETLFAFARDGDVVSVAEAEANRFAITGPFAAGLLPVSRTAERPSCHPHHAGRGPASIVPQGSDRDTVGGDRHRTMSRVTQEVGRSPDPGKVREAPWAGNLVTSAADAFTRSFGIAAAHAITLDKRLPIASGIGGGSADAAATLRALARLHGVDDTDPRLFAIAEALGADVPACLLGRTTIGVGKGEALTEIDGLPANPLLLVNPGVAVSTGAVFAGWDGVDRGGIPGGDLLARARAGRNDLEAPALAIAPVIAEVRALLDASDGVLLSRMSGSGATCFALFETAAQRGEAAERARARGWWCLETALA